MSLPAIRKYPPRPSPTPWSFVKQLCVLIDLYYLKEEQLKVSYRMLYKRDAKDSRETEFRRKPITGTSLEHWRLLPEEAQLNPQVISHHYKSPGNISSFISEASLTSDFLYHWESKAIYSPKLPKEFCFLWCSDFSPWEILHGNIMKTHWKWFIIIFSKF